jgi:hypothetical protein
MNSSTKKEARLFNLTMKNLRDRKKKKRKRKRKRKKNLLSFQGPSPLVCPIIVSRAVTSGVSYLLSFQGPSPLVCPIFTNFNPGS